MALLFVAGLASAQATFFGSNTNTAGTSFIPGAAGSTADCSVAGTTFNLTVPAGCAAGTIGAGGVSIQSVNVRLNHTWDGDLEMFLIGPGGQVLELSTGNGGSADNFGTGTQTSCAAPGTGITYTVFTDAAATFITAGAAPFAGSFRPEGRQTAQICLPSNAAAPGTFTLANTFAGAPVTGTWALRFFDNTGGDSGNMVSWSMTFGGVAAPAACNMSAAVAGVLPALAIPAPAPACTANIPLPATAGSCTTTEIAASFDAGASYTVVTAPIVRPAGNYNICWRVTNQCGVQSFATQAVAVTAAPPIMSCPANSTITLDPGACDVIYDYLVSATSCAGFAGPLTPLPATATGWSQQGQNTYYMNITNNTTATMTVTQISPRLWGAGQATTMRVSVGAPGTTYVGNQGVAAFWTPSLILATTLPNTGVLPVGATLPLFPLTLTTPFEILPGQTRPVAIHSTAQFGGGPITTNGANGQTSYTNGQLTLNFGPGSLVATNPFPTLQAAPFAGNWTWTGDIQYRFGSTPPATGINNQTPGAVLLGLMPIPPTPPSGSIIPRGVNVFNYKATDALGNMANCSWNVTVLEYPNAITALVCNDLVNISLDQDCSVPIGADMILEGGPYGCYDDYKVTVDRTGPNFMNGPWGSGTVTVADCDKTLGVRVHDDADGDNVVDPGENTCWGFIKVEDKLPPVVVCTNVNVPCSTPTAPTTLPANQNVSLSQDPPTVIPVTVATVTGTFNVTGFPPNATVASFANAKVNLNHTWVSDLSVTLISPAGTRVTLIANPCGTANVDDMNATFQDGAPAFVCPANLAQVPIVNGTFAPAQPLAGFVGQNPNGTWTFEFNDGVGGDGGPVNLIEMNFAVTLPSGIMPAGVATDNCQPNPSTANGRLTFEDSVNDNDCQGVVITRTWTAKDKGGLTATCNQIITLSPSTDAAIVLPPDYDATPGGPSGPGHLPALNCANWIGDYPDPGFDGGNDIPVGGGNTFCDITVTHNGDVVVNVCEGSYKIRREWIIINWCTGTEVEHHQIIKVLDQAGPAICVDADAGTPDCQMQMTTITIGGTAFQLHTIITDPYQCCSFGPIPALYASDACGTITSAQVSTPIGKVNGQIINLGGWPVQYQILFPNNTKCFPVGDHFFDYEVSDACGNKTTTRIRVRVADWVPPVAICQEETVISVGSNDANDCYPFYYNHPTFGPLYGATQVANPNPNNPTVNVDLADPRTLNGGGVVWAAAKDFDSGSYDNCQNIYLTVRRMITADPALSTTYDDLDGTPNCNDDFPFPTQDLVVCDPILGPFLEYDERNVYVGYEFECDKQQFATPNFVFPGQAFPEFFAPNDSIKFYCHEVGTEQVVILRVYQLDENGLVVRGPDNQPIFNECMINVLIQDKVKPLCLAPANKTVDCETFDPLIWYGNLTYSDNCCISNVDTTYQFAFAGGQASTVGGQPIKDPNNAPAAFSQCNFGRVTRVFRVEDCNGNFSACSHTITVNYREQYRVVFPNDRTITQCDTANTPVDRPQIFAENCENIGVTYEDQVFTVVPDACFKIIRKWCVINWCTYNPNLPEVFVSKQNINAVTGPNVWIGAAGTPTGLAWAHAVPNPAGGFFVPAVGAAGGPLVRDVPNGAIPASFLTGDGVLGGAYDGTPAYCYYQIIKVQDQQDPIIVQGPYNPCDYTDNDPDGNAPAVRNRHAGLWNATAFWDPSCGSHDLCEGVKQLYIDASDACSKGEVNARYTLFLDLNGDGVMETTVNSENPTLRFGIGVEYIQANGTSSTLPFIAGSVNDPQLTVNGGQNATAAQIASAVKRRFYVTRDPEWDFNFPFSQDRFLKDIDLPYGNHKIKWTVEDNCGNDVTLEIPVKVQDCKKPTIICQPLHGPAMNGPMSTVTVWATDFAEYAEDNCCLVPDWYSIRKQGQPGFGSGVPPLTPSGGPITSVVFDCNDGGTTGTTPVEVWTRDVAGNYDYCVTYFQVNKQNCTGPSTASVSGALKTEQAFNAQPVEHAAVNITGNTPGIPDPSMFTGADGIYSFVGLPLGDDFVVTPEKDMNPTNGVSTFDLVLISKHILGAETFNTNYKHIAADVNKSGSVSTADIVELRKLILGINADFTNNTSWRFVSKDYNFTTTNPAGENFPEALTVAQLNAALANKDFVSVKIGDINGNAAANSLMQVDDRAPVATQLFDVNDRMVAAGDEFTVEFSAADLAKAQGFQFTMNFNGLEFVQLLPGAGLKVDNFGVFATDKAITTSWNGNAAAASFAVKFRAEKAGLISSMLSVSNRITSAEAYTKDAQRMDVAFRFNGNNGSTIAGVGFELYQNEPNPFVSKTNIGFNLPEAAKATLRVFDATGKLLHSVAGNFAKGFNTVAVDRSVIGQAGLVYYTLETSNDSATKKMILMD